MAEYVFTAILVVLLIGLIITVGGLIIEAIIDGIKRANREYREQIKLRQDLMECNKRLKEMKG